MCNGWKCSFWNALLCPIWVILLMHPKCFHFIHETVWLNYCWKPFASMDCLLFPTPSSECLCLMDENAPFEMFSYVLFELSCICSPFLTVWADGLKSVLMRLEDACIQIWLSCRTEVGIIELWCQICMMIHVFFDISQIVLFVDINNISFIQFNFCFSSALPPSLKYI